MKPTSLNTRIFLDSGNPEDTKAIFEELGFLDGQTTNPSLVAKNPKIQELKSSGKLTEEIIWKEYKKIALKIQDILPNGAISVEVYSDAHTQYEPMLAQAEQLATWFPGVYVKLPTTKVGLEVAHILISKGIRVNMTLCFSQEQAAAIHMSTAGAKQDQVFVSPFVGRLDDIGINGIDLVKNIQNMYQAWESHVMVLGASIRNLGHLQECFDAGINSITAPMAILKEWKDGGFQAGEAVVSVSEKVLESIEYKELPQQDWDLYDLHHQLTDAGIEKFASDWKGLFSN